MIEQDCTITAPDGTKYAAGGAVVTPTVVIGYVGKQVDGPAYQVPMGSTSTRVVYAFTDWHGNRIGTCSTTGKPWRQGFVNLYQFIVTTDGATYTGRGQGEGMILRARRVASELTAITAATTHKGA